MEDCFSFSYFRHEALWRRVESSVPQDDLAHDRYHIKRVYDWALRLASEAGVDPDLAGACALVHDLVSIPKEHRDRPKAGELSARASREILGPCGYTEEEIAAISDAVGTSSWSKGRAPSSALGKVLQDADRLDAIGAIGVARVFATSQAMATRGSAARFYHPDDPAGVSGRELDDRRQALDHFAIKLLKLAKEMHTRAAQEEAARRHAFLEAYVDTLRRELEGA